MQERETVVELIRPGGVGAQGDQAVDVSRHASAFFAALGVTRFPNLLAIQPGSS